MRAAMRFLGWVYTAAILAVTAWLALRAQPSGREPLVWLVILVLATMRSPFLPTYAPFPSLWLATLMIATHVNGAAVVRATIGIGLLLSLSWGIGFLPVSVGATWTTIQTIAAFALVTIACPALREPPAVSLPTTALSGDARA